jgi:hypothetical protein
MLFRRKRCFAIQEQDLGSRLGTFAHDANTEHPRLSPDGPSRKRQYARYLVKELLLARDFQDGSDLLSQSWHLWQVPCLERTQKGPTSPSLIASTVNSLSTSWPICLHSEREILVSSCHQRSTYKRGHIGSHGHNEG